MQLLRKKPQWIIWAPALNVRENNINIFSVGMRADMPVSGFKLWLLKLILGKDHMLLRQTLEIEYWIKKKRGGWKHKNTKYHLKYRYVKGKTAVNGVYK